MMDHRQGKGDELNLVMITYLTSLDGTVAELNREQTSNFDHEENCCEMNDFVSG